MIRDLPLALPLAVLTLAAAASAQSHMTKLRGAAGLGADAVREAAPPPFRVVGVPVVDASPTSTTSAACSGTAGASRCPPIHSSSLRTKRARTLFGEPASAQRLMSRLNSWMPDSEAR